MRHRVINPIGAQFNFFRVRVSPSRKTRMCIRTVDRAKRPSFRRNRHRRNKSSRSLVPPPNGLSQIVLAELVSIPESIREQRETLRNRIVHQTTTVDINAIVTHDRNVSSHVHYYYRHYIVRNGRKQRKEKDARDRASSLNNCIIN